MPANETTRPPSGEPCWVITDGAAGHARQALALAAALGVECRHLVVPLRAPWSWFAPRLLPGARLAFPAAFRDLLAPPWPRLAIGCGRSTGLITRLLPALSNARCRSVQILDPRIDPRHWDLVIAPRHDGLSGANVLSPLGSLHPVDASWLEAGREVFPAIGQLPGPRIGILLGGPRRGVALDLDGLRSLGARLRERARRDGGSLLLVASPRTPPAWFATLREALAGQTGLYWQDARHGANPYAGVLGWADRLVVTPDSVNMLSEAAATGVPVHVPDAPGLPARLARFHAGLREHGVLFGLDDTRTAPAVPLRETAAIAAQVRDRLGP